jgi:hypothetical protein
MKEVARMFLIYSGIGITIGIAATMNIVLCRVKATLGLYLYPKRNDLGDIH